MAYILSAGALGSFTTLSSPTTISLYLPGLLPKFPTLGPYIAMFTSSMQLLQDPHLHLTEPNIKLAWVEQMHNSDISYIAALPMDHGGTKVSAEWAWKCDWSIPSFHS